MANVEDFYTCLIFLVPRKTLCYGQNNYRRWIICMVKNFIIAEAGINHNGELKTALKLVDAAKNSGADAIKFQTYKTEKRIKKKYKNIFNILKKCELSYREFEIIKDYCDYKKITFFSTPFDLEAVDFLYSLKVSFFKIASFDISNKQLIDKIIKKKN